ncbi:MAG: efflux RND transporter periplasmic adaptor subunit [Aureispira sp.]
MKNILLGVVLTLFLLLTIWLISYFYNGAGNTTAETTTTTAYSTSIVSKAVATGTVKPRIEIIISSQVPGIVDEVFVKGGDLVKKGDPIVRLQLVPSPTALNNAKASVELARLRLEEAKRRLKQQKGINNKRFDIQQAEAEFARAELQEQKYAALFKDGVVPELEYLEYQTALNLARTSLENARIGSTNSLKEIESQVDVLAQELESAVNNVQLLQKGVASKSGQVANIIRSTVDGMVLDVESEVGDAVIERSSFSAGTGVATVANMQDLVFEGFIDESDVGQLKKGMKLELTVGAIDEMKFDAVLDYISPKGAEETGSIKFEILADVVQREEVFLRAGYSASADIILNKKNDVLAILERDLLFEDDGKPYVEMLIEEEGVFEKRYVEVGLSDGLNIEITKGLTKDDLFKVQGPVL